jgi:6-phosphogluconate dehydrogenase (decarboxylating)
MRMVGLKIFYEDHGLIFTISGFLSHRGKTVAPITNDFKLPNPFTFVGKLTTGNYLKRVHHGLEENL